MSFCSNCGSEVSGEDRFCPGCGHPVRTGPSPTHPTAAAETSAPFSVPAAMPPSGQEVPEALAPGRRLPAGWLVGGGCLAFLAMGSIVIAILFHVSTGGATEAARSHFEMIKSGDVDSAWRTTSEAFRSVTSLENYHGLVAARPALGQTAEISISERKLDNDLATLQVQLSTTIGPIYNIPVQVRKESDGRWRVSALDYSGVPEAATPPSTAATPVAEVRPPPGSPVQASGPVTHPVPSGPFSPGAPPRDPVVQEAMVAADSFYAWYLAKWEEPDIEPEWFETSHRLTSGFLAAWKRVQARGVRPGEEEALDYDLVTGAQEVPFGGFKAVYGEPGGRPGTVRVILLAVGWDMTLDVLMWKEPLTGAWQVDAIQDLNQDLSELSHVEIPPVVRSEATLSAIFDLLKTSEVWQAYAMTTSGFQEKVTQEAFAAFVQSVSVFKTGAVPHFHVTEATESKISFAIDLGGQSGEAILIDEAGERVWNLHHLVWCGNTLGAKLSLALDATIGDVLLSHQVDATTGRITEENYVFDAEGRDPIHVEFVVSKAYPGLVVHLTVPGLDTGDLLVDEKVVAPEGTKGDWLVRWQMPRSRKRWATGDYELTLGLQDGLLKRMIFGVR